MHRQVAWLSCACADAWRVTKYMLELRVAWERNAYQEFAHAQNSRTMNVTRYYPYLITNQMLLGVFFLRKLLKIPLNHFNTTKQKTSVMRHLVKYYEFVDRIRLGKKNDRINNSLTEYFSKIGYSRHDPPLERLSPVATNFFLARSTKRSENTFVLFHPAKVKGTLTYKSRTQRYL